MARGTAWITAARAATNALGFLSTLVLARLLAPADFGLVALATTMQAILSSITDLSLASALVQHRNPTDTHFNTAWTLQLLRSVGLAAIFCLGAFPAALVFHEPKITAVMVVLGLSMLLQGLNNPRAIMLTRDLVFSQQFMLQVGQKLAALIVSTAIAFAYKSYWALVWGALAGQVTALAISYAILPFRPRISFRHGRDLFGFSMWLTFGQIINTVNWKFDQLLIGAFLGRAQLGYYTVGDNLAVMPTREATTPITTTLFPAFARLRAEPERLATAYQRAQALVTSIALPAGVGTALIADPLVRLAMGVKWAPSVPVIQVLASVFAFQTLGILSQPLAMATGDTKLLFRRDAQGFAMRLPFIILGLVLDGLTGIIYARALTGCIAIFLHMQVVKKITRLRIRAQLSANIRSILSVTAMAVIVYLYASAFTPQYQTAAGLAFAIASQILIGATTYVGCHALSWVWMGRPEGPETELARAGRNLLRKIRIR